MLYADIADNEEMMHPFEYNDWLIKLQKMGVVMI